MTAGSYHEPVLARESVSLLVTDRDGIYVDATFGGGGHSALILASLAGGGRLLAFDQDDDVLGHLPNDSRFRFHHHNFRYLRQFLRLDGITQVDGILADLGVSSHQLDRPERGFSHRFDERLDMRMSSQSARTAADVINDTPVGELQALFSRYGEVRNARSLAERIVLERMHRAIRTTGDLVNVVSPLVRGQRNRYLSQVFQALRIVVNDEMGALSEFLTDAGALLRPGGRLVVISYHSLEDRMVKNFLRTGNTDGTVVRDFFGNIYRPFRAITKGAAMPPEEEMERNPRARSARMRAGEKVVSVAAPGRHPADGQ
ncbi:MAG: hypothetical protein RLY31_2776 [Bacteroidota bacterium]|jgi:16S rRNA (cytosine1402-N4)-methyltransferase